MKKYPNILVVSLFLLLFLFPFATFSKMGVGIGNGLISMDEPLMPGGIYLLPDLPVINTGDEVSGYEVLVEYASGVQEIMPEKEWISFTPNKFNLEPGENQSVKVVLSLPTDAKPGDYFVFLQAQPVKINPYGEEKTSVNVAAACKLYFTIAPANIFQAIYYRTLSLYKQYYPYDAIALGIVFFIILILTFKSKFNIQISTKKTGRSKK